MITTCGLIGIIFVQEKKRREAYEEFLKEKLMIDEIVRKIYEEDQRYNVHVCGHVHRHCGVHVL